MACSLSDNVDEIKAIVPKQIEDKVRQLAIMNLAVEYDNASTAKDELQKSYEKCNDILQETRGSSSQQHTHHQLVLDEETLRVLDEEALRETTTTTVDEYEICDEYLTKKQRQLVLDEEALRGTLKDEARA
nr:hypothetical protein [Tanacetum cinerariifolium]